MSRPDKNIGRAIIDEIMALPPDEPAAELSGFTCASRSCGSEGQFAVSAERICLARRVVQLLRQMKLRGDLNDTAFNARMGARESVEDKPARKMPIRDGLVTLDRRRRRARINIRPGELAAIRRASAGLSGAAIWAWMRGVWCAGGFIYLPQNGYYMNIRVPRREEAVARIAEALGTLGIAPSVRDIGRSAEFTITNQEWITASLAAMGAVKSALALEETAMLRSIKSRANKLVNCDQANISKSVSAAIGQMALVRAIDERNLWDELPPDLAELARLRSENPSVSLRELGAMTERKVSKSTVEYRWKKLESMLSGSQQGEQ